jgi:hypothetical protein
MDGLQPTYFSTDNVGPSGRFIRITFHLVSGGENVVTYLFHSWEVDAFTPQEPASRLSAQEISTTKNSADEIPDRVEDARVEIGESISTWGVVTRNSVVLRLNGFVFFDGWVDAERGSPSGALSGTWTRH